MQQRRAGIAGSHVRAARGPVGAPARGARTPRMPTGDVLRRAAAGGGTGPAGRDGRVARRQAAADASALLCTHDRPGHAVRPVCRLLGRRHRPGLESAHRGIGKLSQLHHARCRLPVASDRIGAARGASRAHAIRARQPQSVPGRGTAALRRGEDRSGRLRPQLSPRCRGGDRDHRNGAASRRPTDLARAPC